MGALFGFNLMLVWKVVFKLFAAQFTETERESIYGIERYTSIKKLYPHVCLIKVETKITFKDMKARFSSPKNNKVVLCDIFT